MATTELIGTWPNCCGLRQQQHSEELRELQSQVWILGYLGLFEEFMEGVFLVCLDFVVGFWWLYTKKFIALIRGQFVTQHVALLEAKGTQSFHSWPILCIFRWWRRIPVSPNYQRMAARHTWCQIDKVLFAVVFTFPEMWDRWNFTSAPSVATSVVCTNIKEWLSITFPEKKQCRPKIINNIYIFFFWQYFPW